MKKLILNLCLLAGMLPSPLHAQEAIMPGMRDIKSPVVSEAGSVQFWLNAPHAKKVYITGNITRFNKGDFDPSEQPAKGLVPLKNDGGLWEVRLDSLVPDLYTYKFVVDGIEVLDPLNSHVLRDVASVSNMVLVPGEESKDFVAAGVPRGSVHTSWYRSCFRDTDRRLSIYLPAGYDSSDRHYPVLYLLHGMGGDETAWLDQGRAAEILDNLIARGEAEPMIVVMPNGNMALDAAPGHGPLGLDQPNFYLPHTMDGVFETYFPEIVNYVDSTFRTIPAKESRAVAGLSMGGFHSLYLSANYPGLFNYVGLFSPAVDPTQFNKNGLPEMYRDRRVKIKDQFRQGVRLYYMAIGEDDFLYEDNKKFRAELDADSIPYIYKESKFGHEWTNWRRYLADYLPRLFR